MPARTVTHKGLFVHEQLWYLREVSLCFFTLVFFAVHCEHANWWFGMESPAGIVEKVKMLLLLG